MLRWDSCQGSTPCAACPISPQPCTQVVCFTGPTIHFSAGLLVKHPGCASGANMGPLFCWLSCYRAPHHWKHTELSYYHPKAPTAAVTGTAKGTHEQLLHPSEHHPLCHSYIHHVLHQS